MDRLGLIGVFLGGALPWLEAVVVIPVGIAAGLDPVAVLAAGFLGNLLTIAVAAFAGERLRTWWRARRGGTDARRSRPGRTGRAARAFDRWGLLGVALVGPLAGTQMCAALAVGMGARAGRTTLWVGAGTLAWCVAAAVLTVSGSSLLGIGA